VLKGHATLTMSVTRRIRERRSETRRVGPAGVDQQGSLRRRVSREGTREAVRSMLPILLVVASNLGAWGVAALNRSGEPEAVLLELTERELRLPARQAENTALTLRIVFIGGRDGGTSQPREAGWFDRAKLQSIGFDCSRPVAQEHAAHYRSRPPRMTYAAMEYEGESWRGKMAQLASDSPLPPVQGVAPERPAAAGGSGIAAGDPAGTTTRRGQDNLLPSRLVAIDVDNDPVALSVDGLSTIDARPTAIRWIDASAPAFSTRDSARSQNGSHRRHSRSSSPAQPGAGPHRRRAQHPTAGSRTATLTRHWMVTRQAAKSPSVVRRFLSDLEYVDCIAPCLPLKVTHSGSGRAKT